MVKVHRANSAGVHRDFYDKPNHPAKDCRVNLIIPNNCLAIRKKFSMKKQKEHSSDSEDSVEEEKPKRSKK